MRYSFLQLASLDFRRHQKREFYAAMYGNYGCEQFHHDWVQMYLMGNEL